VPLQRPSATFHPWDVPYSFLTAQDVDPFTVVVAQLHIGEHSEAFRCKAYKPVGKLTRQSRRSLTVAFARRSYQAPLSAGFVVPRPTAAAVRGDFRF
jgi:hypothetical protein